MSHSRIIIVGCNCSECGGDIINYNKARIILKNHDIKFIEAG